MQHKTLRTKEIPHESPDTFARAFSSKSATWDQALCGNLSARIHAKVNVILKNIVGDLVRSFLFIKLSRKDGLGVLIRLQKTWAAHAMACASLRSCTGQPPTLSYARRSAQKRSSRSYVEEVNRANETEQGPPIWLPSLLKMTCSPLLKQDDMPLLNRAMTVRYFRLHVVNKITLQKFLFPDHSGHCTVLLN